MKKKYTLFIKLWASEASEEKHDIKTGISNQNSMIFPLYFIIICSILKNIGIWWKNIGFGIKI